MIRDLDQMGNLGAVFSLAYDRGGKVINMIENRLGTAPVLRLHEEDLPRLRLEDDELRRLPPGAGGLRQVGRLERLPRRLADRASRPRLVGRVG